MVKATGDASSPPRSGRPWAIARGVLAPEDGGGVIALEIEGSTRSPASDWSLGGLARLRPEERPEPPASPGPQGRTTTALSGHWVGPPAPRADHPTRPTSRDPGRFAERTVAVLALGFRGNPKSPWTNLQPKGEPGRLVGDEETAPMTETFPDTAWGSLHLSGFPPRGNDNAS